MSKIRDTEAAFNIRPSAVTKLSKIKGADEANQKLIEQIKEQERGHEFLNLEKQMADSKGKKYQFDHKRIQQIRERELRALERRN